MRIVGKPDGKFLGRGPKSNGGRPMNSRNLLLMGGVLLSLLLLFVVMGLNFARSYRTARNEVVELSRSSSIHNANNFELFFLRHEDVLLTTAEMLDFTLERGNVSVQEVEDMLHNISVTYNDQIYSKYANTEFTGIYAAVDGALLHGMRPSSDLPIEFDMYERQWYKEGLAGNGEVVFGDLYLDVYTDTMVMTATKLLKDGQTVIAMDISTNDLQHAGGGMEVSFMLNGKEHVCGYSFVLTDDGVVMAHRDKTKQGLLYDDPDSPYYLIFQQIRQCSATGTEYFEAEIDGATYGIFPQRLENGWYVVTLMDLQSIRASLSDFSTVLLVGTGVATLIALLYCILITRTLVKSERLTDNLKNALVLAKKDGLTGYGNRTAYDMRIGELRAGLNTENDRSFVAVMLDLNDLKYINDNYGHAAGDQYIRNSCRLVRGVMSSEVYRIGGDEFALFLTGEDFEKREDVIARLKEAVAEANALLVPNVDKPSMALGIAVHFAGAEEEMDELIRHADSEMYADKSDIKKARVENTENNG